MPLPAFEIFGEDRPGRWLLTCDHASNRVPDDVGGGDLGLSDTDMERHIAYDIGAAGVTRHLAKLLDCPAVLSTFSRLVIDPNRGDDDPTQVMRLYDGTIIPTNRHIDDREIERRRQIYHRPYHQAVARLAERAPDTPYIAIHSYGPKLAGRAPRPWHVGFLHSGDTRLSDPVIARMSEDPALCVGDNQPYSGHLPGDSVDRHALSTGRPNILVEVRHDLIRTDAQQADWAARLAPVLREAAATL